MEDDVTQERPEVRGSRPGSRLLWLIPVVAVLAVIGYASIQKQRPESITAALARGEQPAAPEFRLSRLNAPGALALSELRGQYVVLNFWASWCIPCKDEAPQLERLWQTYRDRGLVVLGVNIQDLEQEAMKFLAQTRPTYPNVRDIDGAVYRAYGLTGVPETFFITREGRIIRKFPGAVVDWSVWRDAAEDLLR
jgi:cytochrome c biogenesis protein CcmG/thiol:disulfide interchange protein DsbE